MKLSDGRLTQSQQMARAAVLILAALSPSASGLAAIHNGTSSAKRGFLTPMGADAVAGDLDASTLPEAKCSCDLCVSAHRTNPTAVSDTKCVPRIDVAQGLTCDPQSKFPADTHDTDVPYQLFCMCACQPFISVNSQVAASSEPTACVDLSKAEKKQVDHPQGQPAENCVDPKFPTQMEQNEMDKPVEEVAKMAKEANTPPPAKAADKLAAAVGKVFTYGNETVRQKEASGTAKSTAKMLMKNPIWEKIGQYH